MSYILIVEDSAVDREIISRCLRECTRGIEIRCVADAFQAREVIAEKDPILIVLDIELPKMSGGEFLGHLMRHHPLPVIVVTRELGDDCERYEKLQMLGAVRVLYKPKSGDDQARFAAQLTQILETVLRLRSNVAKAKGTDGLRELSKPNNAAAGQVSQSSFALQPIVIALGASTGGPVAISEVVRHFSANSPPVLIAQHISDRFSGSLVQGLQRLTEMKVALAESGTQIAWGCVYIAPAESHMEIDSGGRIKILSAVAADRFTPSVNILFHSLARIRRISAIGALLTGMGNDGADGLLRMRNTGALTIAEHRDSCVVYGMPARAAEIDAASEILRLPEIGPRIRQHVEELCRTKNLRTSKVAQIPAGTPA